MLGRPFLGLLLSATIAFVAFAMALPAPAGRLHAETFVLQTDMYGAQQVPPVNTIAYGFVRFFFNDSRTAADYTVDVKGYSDSLVLGADIHRGAPGVNGPVVRHLADGGFIVTSGRIRLSEQDLRELAAGVWYVSLKTIEHPEGDLRGQIILPEGFLASLPALPASIIAPESPQSVSVTGASLPAARVELLAEEAIPAPLGAIGGGAPGIDAPSPVLVAQPVASAAGAPAGVPVIRPPNTGTGGLVH